jgi:hypothetical protein
VTDPLHLDDDTIEIRRLVELGLARSKSAGPCSKRIFLRNDPRWGATRGRT